MNDFFFDSHNEVGAPTVPNDPEFHQQLAKEVTLAMFLKEHGAFEEDVVTWPPTGRKFIYDMSNREHIDLPEEYQNL